MKQIKKYLQKISLRLSQPDIFFYSGLWLLVLLFIGTISQKYIGLYRAQFQFFSSFFFWIGHIPLPAGRSIMTIIFLSLSFKLLFYTKNLRRNLGSFIVHLGILLLIAGGFVTALLSQEAYIQIPEGKSGNIVLDYHQAELALINKKTMKEITFNEKALKNKNNLLIERGLVLEIKNFFKNTEIIKRPTPASSPFKGFSKIFEIKKKSLEKENENNLAGLRFQISRNNTVENYSVFEGMPISQTLKWQDQVYLVKLRPLQTRLPFSIYLLDFKKNNYPGTLQARSYQSTVEIREASRTQKRVIKMNEPLRYGGWTFYQSSFVEKANSEETVLAGVKNAGRFLPYLSSLIICFGLLIHIFLHVSIFKTRKKRL